MIKFLFLIAVVTTFSCTTKTAKPRNNIELAKQYDYYITIEISNSFFGYGSEYILDNRATGTFEFENLISHPLNPFTLYHILYKKGRIQKKTGSTALVPIDTIQVPISKELSDTLFYLTRDFFKSVSFNNYDTAINGRITREIIYDDSHAFVMLDYRGRRLNATIKSISNEQVGTAQLHQLFDFIDKFDVAKK